MRSLRSALIDEPLPRLMAIAEAWDLFLEAATPRELAEKLPAIMAVADNIERAKTMLPAEALTALEVLLAADGRMPVAVFERRFGVLRQMGPGKLERERPWINPINRKLLSYRDKHGNLVPQFKKYTYGTIQKAWSDRKNKQFKTLDLSALVVGAPYGIKNNLPE